MKYHRYRSIALSVLGALGFAVSFCVSLVISPVAVCVLALRADYGNAPRFIMKYCLAAFRIIREMKPVYRESHRTHGLSLSGMAA